MTTTIITGPAEYAALLLRMEAAGPASIRFASSFLSSTYFSEKAIRRFYDTPHTRAPDACEALLLRRSLATAPSSSVRRMELYESEAFTSILSQGVVHGQESAYRSRPSEIREVLETVLDRLRAPNPLEIAITTEVLPLVFAIYSPATVVIDIRTNYLYQRLQGLLLENEMDAIAVFTAEFTRLWDEAISTASSTTIIEWLQESLDQ